MPPKRRHAPEGEPDNIPGAAIPDPRGLMDGFGFTYEEAHTVVYAPADWMERLRKEPISEILPDMWATINDYETRFGLSRHWDILRIMAAEALVLENNLPDAAEFLSGVQDIYNMLEDYHYFVSDAVRDSILDFDTVIAMDVLIQHSFERQGKLLTYLREARNLVIRLQPHPLLVEDEIDAHVGTPVDRIADWAEIERPHFPLASWDHIVDILRHEEDWANDIGLVARRHISGGFAGRQQAMFEKPKIERKDVEDLKAALAQSEIDSPAAVWDRFRFAAALSLYDAGAPNFARGMVRAMTDEEMMAMVCFALVETGQDKEALAVAYEIPAYIVFAKVLYTAEWADRAPIDELIEDMTYATLKNKRKYDPAMRIGVAVGLLELFTARSAEAEAAGDTEAIARWQSEAQEMEKRLHLLRLQAKNKFITAPKSR